jgi:uncharacterized protein YigA (DUF484 family)
MTRKSESPGQTDLPPVSSAQVVAYLRAHPDFLSSRPDLMARLAPPSRYGAGAVVDFQQFMISKLQDEVDQMRGCAEHLISTSRNNMSTQTRTHEAVLCTLAAGDLAGLARTVIEDYPALLDVDLCCLGFEPEAAGQSRLFPGIGCLPEGLVEQLLGAGEVMLRSQANGDPLLFGDAAGLVSSFALVRIEAPGCPLGLLALGSRHDRTFQASQGTELLAFLAHVIEDCMARWWPQD